VEPAEAAVEIDRLAAVICLRPRAVMRVVAEDDAEVIMMSVQGLVTRTDVRSIRRTGRATQGVIVMRLNKGDSVVSMATLSKAEEI